MNFVSSGQGEAVLLIHGLFGNLDNLKGLGQVIETHHQVIRVDVPNHGLSEHWQQMDYPSLAKAMVDLLDDLKLERVHIVGHSMGGKIAMATALAYPERIISMVAADIAPVAYQPRHDVVFAALESLPLEGHTDRRFALAHLTHSGIDEATAQFLLKNLQRTETGFRWKMNLSGLKACYPNIIGWHNLVEEKRQTYHGPSLFIRGGDSNYVTGEHRNAIMTQFPLAQAKTLEGCGHWLHAQKPTIFNRIVSEFIDKHTV
ncbi:alpha/beta fold hydrolase [Shewanella xiamenensis]|uniref:alpha/beta fold hydrolase n=1 Tax=Shewanella xiamenensis TaxID=332186 RepID=UPI0004D4D5D9|nr:alpha/beta fold hydrolase [Shewanella xiamenensis]KEK28306.1 alpha/beta hydrolase fold domain-containing protein [Shewanella xiamenensis]NSM24543.1 alpha/beta fold hydrolase [Shewanella sp. ZOR0012]UML91899.1 alpha/beta fold hydrolase [Shewanella xiamenensis]